MLTPPFDFSQSSLQDYYDCPRRFKLRYLEKLIYPAVESEPALENERHLQEGQFFHRLAQQNLLGISTEKLTRLANTPNLQRWWDNFLHFQQSSLYDLSEIYPEILLASSFGNFRLVAKYDLITVTEDRKLLIYDWKTYRRRPRNEWLSTRWQTRIYQMLLVMAGAQLNNGKPIVPEQCEMVYWFANFPHEAARFLYDDKKFKMDQDAITGMIDEIQSTSDFPMTDDRQKCTYCPYRSYCDRGIQAGDMEVIESEFQTKSLFNVDFEEIGEIEFYS